MAKRKQNKQPATKNKQVKLDLKPESIASILEHEFPNKFLSKKEKQQLKKLIPQLIHNDKGVLELTMAIETIFLNLLSDSRHQHAEIVASFRVQSSILEFTETVLYDVDKGLQTIRLSESDVSHLITIVKNSSVLFEERLDQEDSITLCQQLCSIEHLHVPIVHLFTTTHPDSHPEIFEILMLHRQSRQLFLKCCYGSFSIAFIVNLSICPRVLKKLIPNETTYTVDAIIQHPDFDIKLLDHEHFSLLFQYGFWVLLQTICQQRKPDFSSLDNITMVKKISRMESLYSRQRRSFPKKLQMLLQDPNVKLTSLNKVQIDNEWLHLETTDDMIELIPILLEDPRYNIAADNYVFLKRAIIHGNRNFLIALFQHVSLQHIQVPELSQILDYCPRPYSAENPFADNPSIRFYTHHVSCSETTKLFAWHLFHRYKQRKRNKQVSRNICDPSFIYQQVFKFI